ncbi:MAG: hypothetical protein HQ522_21820 [Bacteroidetes bacterium]|nr:hypothetical protein [Bacteroidota bacterium]
MLKQNKIKQDCANKMAIKSLKQTGNPELRSRLPRGAVRDISNELNISWIWAYRVIIGKEKGDPRIVSMALEHAKIEDEKRERMAGLIERNNKELQKIK